MKQNLLLFLIVCFLCVCFYAYHLALVWLASIFSWEGTAIGLSIFTFGAGVFFAGAGRINKEYDKAFEDEYKDNRIQGLEDQQKADEDIIRTLRSENEKLRGGE